MPPQTFMNNLCVGQIVNAIAGDFFIGDKADVGAVQVLM